MEQPACFKKYHLNSAKSALVVEFVGTFLFVLTIPLSIISSGEVAPLSIGFMLMAMIFCFGYISGGHFNPAVTFAVVLCKPADEPWNLGKRLAYWVAQIGGACCAALYCFMIHGTDFPTPDTANDPIKIARGFIAESVYTFVLASVVLHVACSRQKDNNFYGFAIGMAVLSAALCVGGVSGGAFNPAVATGLITIRCLTGYCVPMYHLWMYWAAELLGALVAAIIYTAVSDAMNEADKAKRPDTDQVALSSSVKTPTKQGSAVISSATARAASGTADANPLDADN